MDKDNQSRELSLEVESVKNQDLTYVNNIGIFRLGQQFYIHAVQANPLSILDAVKQNKSVYFAILA